MRFWKAVCKHIPFTFSNIATAVRRRAHDDLANMLSEFNLRCLNVVFQEPAQIRDATTDEFIQPFEHYFGTAAFFVLQQAPQILDLAFPLFDSFYQQRATCSPN